ncbi:gas vesicle protein GvpFL [Prescottella agglutinans]|uniref:Gas vesicle protein GvpFL n=1 Tax=Prescottella agglutinans TaxID=1644129 RepID=A0A438BDT4_9NOCA|nr:GvpL/GvpF family gas vesicle protein [Prescottella agglutinans]RVW09159.1 gas vesicle protein GvpFL [Prescottella agglutinans]
MTDQKSESGDHTTAVYVYGLVPADVEVKPDATGIGTPPAPLSTVTFDDIAALVSEIDPDGPVGTPEDLRAHARILDTTAAVAPVLPFQFGAVMTDADAVVSELLEPYRDEFTDALDQLEGLVEYVVKGKYVEDAVLREILSGDDEANRLREIIRDQPEEVTRDARLALGERIAQELETKRGQDTQQLLEALEQVAEDVRVRDVTDDEDAGSVAVLIAADNVDALDKTVERLNQEWEGRVDLSVLGPLAAYDFAKTRAPGS